MVSPRGIDWLRFWVGFMAGLSALGWALSAVGILGTAGYALGLPPLIYASLWAARRSHSSPELMLNRPAVPWVRFRRLPPALFLLLAVGGGLSGFLYSPSGHDALRLHLPRQLHWLTAGHWHSLARVNSGPLEASIGFEWAMIPLLTLSANDRWLHAVSGISYLLLPGLTYAIAIRLGIERRVAWAWMWLLPTGYGFALSLGGVSPYLLATGLALAAFLFALKARQSSSASDARFAVLAAAAMVGTLVSTVPLLLPWAAILWPVRDSWSRGKLKWGLTLGLAFLVSPLPVWMAGAAASQRAEARPARTPTVGYSLSSLYPTTTAENLAVLALQNLQVPSAPGANGWLRAWADAWPKGTGKPRSLSIATEPSASWLRAWPAEEFAGLGLPLTGLAALSLIRRLPLLRRPFTSKPPPASRAPAQSKLTLVRSGIWVAAGLNLLLPHRIGIAREFLPYYPLLILTVLKGEPSTPWRRSGWRSMAALLMGFSSLLFAAVSPTRPWWPALTVLAGETATEREPFRRMGNWYHFFRERPQALDRLLARIPPEMNQIGLLAPASTAEAPFWRPYGRRQVIRPSDDGSPSDFLRQQASYVFVRDSEFTQFWPAGLADWLSRGRAEELGNLALAESPVDPPVRWILVRLREGNP